MLSENGTVLINEPTYYVCFAQLQDDLKDTSLHILFPIEKEGKVAATCIIAVGSDGVNDDMDSPSKMIYYVFKDGCAGYAYLTDPEFFEDTIRDLPEFRQELEIDGRMYYLLDRKNPGCKKAIVFDGDIVYQFLASTESELMQMLEMLE